MTVFYRGWTTRKTPKEPGKKHHSVDNQESKREKPTANIGPKVGTSNLLAIHRYNVMSHHMFSRHNDTRVQYTQYSERDS